MPLHLPPLRERREDIPLLVTHFIELFNKKLGKNIKGFSSEAMALLIGREWPGNIRELENLVERTIVLAKGEVITPLELPPSITENLASYPSGKPEHTLSVKKATKKLERELIEKALKLTGGNRSKAAKILEISRPILIAKIKEYGLS